MALSPARAAIKLPLASSIALPRAAISSASRSEHAARTPYRCSMLAIPRSEASRADTSDGTCPANGMPSALHSAAMARKHSGESIE